MLAYPYEAVSIASEDLHVMGITTNSKRKAATQECVFRGRIRILDRAAGKNGFLIRLESNGTEFFPIADERVLSHDFMQSQFTL